MLTTKERAGASAVKLRAKTNASRANREYLVATRERVTIELKMSYPTNRLKLT